MRRSEFCVDLGEAPSSASSRHACPVHPSSRTSANRSGQYQWTSADASFAASVKTGSIRGIPMGNINWPEVTVGFVLGLTPLAARQIYIVIKYVRLPGKRKYLGHWWSYHKSTTGTGHIIEEKVEIKYSLLLDRLTVRSANEEQNYTGTISARQGMVRYVDLKENESNERVLWYLFDPFQASVERTVGVYIALDLNGIPAAGPMLLSKERLSAPMVPGKVEGDVVRIDTSAI